MARSVRRICSFGAGSVAQPASASTARAANRGRILTKKSLRFWGADRLQLPLPTLQIALQRGFGQAGGGQFCHLFRQLSAQPGVIAGRVVGNGKKQTGLIDRLRVSLEVVGITGKLVREEKRVAAALTQAILEAHDYSVKNPRAVAKGFQAYAL